ncbi:protein GOLM2 isoform X2 [Scyliorhinus torazame]|uniref:protein GOLM2 isoform X2 n=1 Tax=Scyliorhinus torazame TaxID=75743 RepID=UPI003B5C599E
MMFGNSRRGGRLPSLLLVGLLLLLAGLAFNYWALSGRHSRLQLEVTELQVQVKKTDTAKSRLEKRNSELMGQVDTHRRQLDEKEDECSNLGNQLQNKENLMKKCFEEKVKFQNNITDQLSLIHRLQEQLTELRHEYIRQGDQLQEYRKNSTSLEKKLEYESLQCGQQISALKEQCEEKLKTLGKVHDQPSKYQDDSIKQKQAREEDEKVVNPQNSDWDYSKAKVNPPIEKQMAESNKPSINLNEGNKLQHHQDDDQKLPNLGKADDDAGMPGIEENEQSKPVDLLNDHKKNKLVVEEIEKSISRGGGIPGDKLNADAEMMPVHHFERGPAMQAPPPNQVMPYDNQQNIAKPGKSLVVKMPNLAAQENREDEELPVRADEIGESPNRQPGQERPHQGKPMHHLAKEPAMQPPPNQALHFPAGQAFPNHFQHRGGKGHEKANEAGEHPKSQQGQFFDENESPADPQHDSKVADYNGDDGNVGEYEADKQAELAYNEEEDGDGGEEDVQDEEEQELQGDLNNPAVYENHRFAADGL